MQTHTLIAALAVAGCGSVATPLDPDAAGAEPDALEIPLHCGNQRPDLGEDCDGTPGCSPTCHLAPGPGTVAIRFRGVVIRLLDPQGVFGGEIRTETPLWGRVVYATDLANQSADAGVGDYPYTNAGARDTRGIWLSVALWSFHPDRGTGQIIVRNSADGGDGFYALLGNGVVSPPVAGLQSVVVDLVDPSRSALVSEVLPAVSFPPATAWGKRSAYVLGSNALGLTWELEATIDDVMLETPAP